MRNRRVFQIALSATLMLALALLTSATAWADDGDAPVRKKVRVRVTKREEAPAQGQKKAPAPNPLDTVMRWAMGELGAQVGKDGKGGDADARLRKWFEGGDDVPLAGLRDALKADGWTPEKLKAWGMAKAMQAGPQMMQLFANRSGPMGARRGGPMGQGGLSVLGPMSRSFTTFGSAAGPGHGAAGCPLCGEGGQQRWGRRGGPGRRGAYGRQGMRRGPWGRRGPGGFRGPRGQGRWGGGMGPHGPMHGSSHAVILWNDGSGWHRREIPGGMGHGQRGSGMPPFMGGHGGMGPGGGQMPAWMRQLMGGQHPPMQGPQGVQGPGQAPWKKMLEGFLKNQGGQSGEADVNWLNLLQQLQKSQGEDGSDLRALLKSLQGMGAAGGQPKVKVHVVRPKPLEEDVVEDEPVKKEKSIR